MKKNPQVLEPIDGVQYRRAKLWQIILYACSALSNMAVYILIQQASYAASIGFGISTAIIGVIIILLSCYGLVTGIYAYLQQLQII